MLFNISHEKVLSFDILFIIHIKTLSSLYNCVRYYEWCWVNWKKPLVLRLVIPQKGSLFRIANSNFISRIFFISFIYVSSLFIRPCLIWTCDFTNFLRAHYHCATQPAVLSLKRKLGNNDLGFWSILFNCIHVY